MNDKLYPILEKFVVENNIKINPQDFKLQLISNPSFPSLKSISDTLDYYGIDNIVVNVPKEALNQLPKCFIALIENEKGQAIAQVQQTEKWVKLFKDDGTKEKLSIKSFMDTWTGTIIAVEKNETKINNSNAAYKNPIVLLALLSIVVLGIGLFSLTIPAITYTLLAVIGCCCSYFIVEENLGLNNVITSKICNSAANNTNCGDVINGTSGKLLNLLPLSDISITFFVSVLIIIGIFGYNPMFFLVISVASIPIVLYSIYAQAYVIKKWCPLCLGISGVLLLQALSTSFGFDSQEINLIYIMNGIALFIAIYLLWAIIKKVLVKSIKYDDLQMEFLKFKRNENLFETLLHKKSLRTNIPLNSNAMISFGNPDASLELYSITNPLCGFCTKAFESYDTLLKTHGSKFKLHIIFNVDSDTHKQASTQISQRIIELYQSSPKKSYAALKDWFAERNVQQWQDNYGIPPMDAPLQILASHYNWCTQNDINYTPATIIGNHFFPQEYELEDLSLFIDYLIEHQKNTDTISSHEPVNLSIQA